MLERTKDAGGDVVIEMPPALRERVLARLVAILRARSDERVRIPGVGLLGVQRALGWPSSSPTIPPVAERVPMAMTSFADADELYELVQGRPASPPSPTDDVELDAFATRVLEAFTRFDAVEIPTVGRLEIREQRGQRRVRMTFSAEMKKALNEVARAGP